MKLNVTHAVRYAMTNNYADRDEDNDATLPRLTQLFSFRWCVASWTRTAATWTSTRCWATRWTTWARRPPSSSRRSTTLGERTSTSVIRTRRTRNSSETVKTMDQRTCSDSKGKKTWNLQHFQSIWWQSRTVVLYLYHSKWGAAAGNKICDTQIKSPRIFQSSVLSSPSLRNDRGIMSNSKYEYVKQFEADDKLLPNAWIVVRVDGKAFHK